MHLITYIFVYPFIFIISHLPFRVLYWLSDFLYFIIYYLAGYRKNVVRENLKLVFPEKSYSERKEIEKKFYHHFTDLFIEMIKVFNMSEKQMNERYNFENPELINNITRKNKSVIIVSGHYANWEWVFSLANYVEETILATYLKINNPFFEKMILKSRERFGGKLIETKNLKKYINDLYNNNTLFILGLLGDQSPQLHRSRYWRDFFGKEVPVFVGAEKLAKKYDTAFIFMSIKKIKRGYYKIYFEEITLFTNKYPDYELTDIYLEKLEKNILKHPEFYLWTHRRFKHFGRKKEVKHLLDKK